MNSHRCQEVSSHSPLFGCRRRPLCVPSRHRDHRIKSSLFGSPCGHCFGDTLLLGEWVHAVSVVFGDVWLHSLWSVTVLDITVRTAGVWTCHVEIGVHFQPNLLCNERRMIGLAILYRLSDVAGSTRISSFGCLGMPMVSPLWSAYPWPSSPDKRQQQRSSSSETLFELSYCSPLPFRLSNDHLDRTIGLMITDLGKFRN